MKKTRLLLLSSISAAVLALSGCSSDESLPLEPQDPAPVINLKGHTKDVRVGTRDLTLNYISAERHGAGIEQGSYKHVLAQLDYAHTESPMLSNRVKYDRKRFYSGQHYASAVSQTPEIKVQRTELSAQGNPMSVCVPDYASLSEMKLGHSADYSPAELSVWQRFCSCGTDLTAADWNFIRQHRDAFPFELKNSCRPPAYENLLRQGLVSDRELLYRQAFGNARKGVLK